MNYQTFDEATRLLEEISNKKEYIKEIDDLLIKSNDPFYKNDFALTLNGHSHDEMVSVKSDQVFSILMSVLTDEQEKLEKLETKFINL